MDQLLSFLSPLLAAAGIAAIIWRLIADSRPVSGAGQGGVQAAPLPPVAAGDQFPSSRRRVNDSWATTLNSKPAVTRLRGG